jgi:hypothetical protein
MKRLLLIAFALALGRGVAACGAGAAGGGSGSGGAAGAGPGGSQLLLVASDRSATVSVHRIDQTMGTLQRLGMPATVAMRPTFAGVLSLP